MFGHTLQGRNVSLNPPTEGWSVSLDLPTVGAECVSLDLPLLGSRSVGSDPPSGGGVCGQDPSVRGQVLWP